METTVNDALQIIENKEFNAKIRTVVIDEEIWFAAVDVCKVLGIKNVPQATDRLKKNEYHMFNIGYSGKRGKPNIYFVNEPGLYRLIFKSRKPEAEKFQDWVYHEVLPSIRKRGYYIAPHQKLYSIEGTENFKKFQAEHPNLNIDIKSIELDGTFFIDGAEKERVFLRYIFVIN